MSTISIHSSDSFQHPESSKKRTSITYKEYSPEKQSRKSNKGFGKRKADTTIAETSFTAIVSVLQNIAKRLEKLEEKEKKGKLPNRS